MEKLVKLYNLRNSLREQKFSIPDDLQHKIAEMELSIMQSRMDDFKLAVGKLINGIQSPIKVVVRNDLNFDMDIEISQGLSSQKLVIKPEKKSLDESNPQKKRTKLVVEFPDGTVIKERRSENTFSRAIYKIGVSRVRELNITHHDTPLISTEKSKEPRYARNQTPIGENLFLLTYGSNSSRRAVLETIAERLGINIKVIQL